MQKPALNSSERPTHNADAIAFFKNRNHRAVDAAAKYGANVFNLLIRNRQGALTVSDEAGNSGRLQHFQAAIFGWINANKQVAAK